jgi:hypothetical protein
VAKSEQKVIDGITFIIQSISVLEAYYMSRDVMEILTPPLSIGAAAFIKDGRGMSMDAHALLRVLGSDALPRLFSGLSRDKLKWLTDSLLKTTIALVGQKKFELGDETNFEAVFDGKVATIYKVLAASIMLNFSSFFPAGAAKQVQDMVAAMAKGANHSGTSPTPSPEPGPAGASS